MAGQIRGRPGGIRPGQGAVRPGGVRPGGVRPGSDAGRKIKFPKAPIAQVAKAAGLHTQEMPWWYKAARVVDIPGRLVRGMLMGDPGRDLWKEPTGEMGGASGWDIMEKWFGLKDTPGRVDPVDIGAFGIEVLTDPLTFALGGFGFGAKQGRLAEKITQHEVDAIANAQWAKHFTGLSSRLETQASRGRGLLAPKRAKHRTYQEGFIGQTRSAGGVVLEGTHKVGIPADPTTMTHLTNLIPNMTKDQLKHIAKNKSLAKFYTETALEEMKMAHRLRTQLDEAGKGWLLKKSPLEEQRLLAGGYQSPHVPGTHLKAAMADLENWSLDDLLTAGNKSGVVDEKALAKYNAGDMGTYELASMLGRGHTVGSFDLVGMLKNMAGKEKYMLHKVASGEIPRLNALLTMGVPQLPVPNRWWPARAGLALAHSGVMGFTRTPKRLLEFIPGVKTVLQGKWQPKLSPVRLLLDQHDKLNNYLKGLRTKLKWKPGARTEWAFRHPKFERNIFQDIGYGIARTRQALGGRLPKWARKGGEAMVESGRAGRFVSEAQKGKEAAKAYGRGFEHMGMRAAGFPFRQPEIVGGTVGGAWAGFSGDPKESFWKKFAGGMALGGAGLGHMGRRWWKGKAPFNLLKGKYSKQGIKELFKTQRHLISPDERAVMEAFERAQAQGVANAADAGTAIDDTIEALAQIKSGSKTKADLVRLIEAERGPPLEVWYMISKAKGQKGETWYKGTEELRKAKDLSGEQLFPGSEGVNQIEVPKGFSQNEAKVWREIIYETHLPGSRKEVFSKLKKLFKNRKDLPELRDAESLQAFIDQQRVRVKARRGDLMGRIKEQAELKNVSTYKYLSMLIDDQLELIKAGKARGDEFIAPEKTLKLIIDLMVEPHKWHSDAREFARTFQDMMVGMLDEEILAGAGSTHNFLRTVTAYYPRMLKPEIRTFLESKTKLKDYINFMSESLTSDAHKTTNAAFKTRRSLRKHLTEEIGLVDFISNMHEKTLDWFVRHLEIEKADFLSKHGHKFGDDQIALNKYMYKKRPEFELIEHGQIFEMDPAKAIVGRQIMSEMVINASLLQQVTISMFAKPIAEMGEDFATVAARATRGSAANPMHFDRNYPSIARKLDPAQDEFIKLWDGKGGPLEGLSEKALRILRDEGWPASENAELRGALGKSNQIIPSVNEFVSPNGIQRPGHKAFYDSLLSSPAVRSGVIGERELAYMRAIFNDMDSEVMERLAMKGRQQVEGITQVGKTGEGTTSLLWRLLPEDYAYWGGAARYERPNIGAINQVMQGKGGSHKLTTGSTADAVHGAGRPFADNAYETTGNIIGLHPHLRGQPTMFKMQVMLHEVFHVLWEDVAPEIRKNFTETLRGFKIRGEMGNFDQLIKGYLGEMRKVIKKSPRGHQIYANDVDKMLTMDLRGLHEKLIEMGGKLDTLRRPITGSPATQLHFRQSKPELVGAGGKAAYSQRALDELAVTGKLREMGIPESKLTAEGIETYLDNIPDNFEVWRERLLGDEGGRVYQDGRRQALTRELQVTGGPMGHGKKVNALEIHKRWERFVAELSQGAAESPSEMFATLASMIVMKQRIPFELVEDPGFLAAFGSQAKTLVQKIKRMFVKSRDELMAAGESPAIRRPGVERGKGAVKAKAGREIPDRPGREPMVSDITDIKPADYDMAIHTLERRMQKYRLAKERNALVDDIDHTLDGPVQSRSKLERGSPEWLREQWADSKAYQQMDEKLQLLREARDELRSGKDSNWTSIFQDFANSYKYGDEAAGEITDISRPRDAHPGISTSARTFGEEGQHMLAMVESMAHYAMGIKSEMYRMTRLLRKRRAAPGQQQRRTGVSPAVIEKESWRRFWIYAESDFKTLDALYKDQEIGLAKIKQDPHDETLVQERIALQRKIKKVEQKIGLLLGRKHKQVDSLLGETKMTSRQRAKETGVIPQMPEGLDTGAIRTRKELDDLIIEDSLDNYTGEMENLFDDIDMESLSMFTVKRLEPGGEDLDAFATKMPIRQQLEHLEKMTHSQALQYRWSYKRLLDGQGGPPEHSPHGMMAGGGYQEPADAVTKMFNPDVDPANYRLDRFGLNLDRATLEETIRTIDGHLLEETGTAIQPELMDSLPQISQMYWGHVEDIAEWHPRFQRLKSEAGIANPHFSTVSDAPGTSLDDFIQDIDSGFQVYNPDFFDGTDIPAVWQGLIANDVRGNLRRLIATGGYDPGGGLPVIRSFHPEDLRNWARDRWAAADLGNTPFARSRMNAERSYTDFVGGPKHGDEYNKLKFEERNYADEYLAMDETPFNANAQQAGGGIGGNGRNSSVVFSKLAPEEKDLVMDMYLDFINASRAKTREVLEYGNPNVWSDEMLSGLPPRSREALDSIVSATGTGGGEARRQTIKLITEWWGSPAAQAWDSGAPFHGRIRIPMGWEDAPGADHGWLRNISRDQYDALAWSRLFSHMQVNTEMPGLNRASLGGQPPGDPQLKAFRTPDTLYFRAGTGAFTSKELRNWHNQLWGHISTHRDVHQTLHGYKPKTYTPLGSQEFGAQGLEGPKNVNLAPGADLSAMQGGAATPQPLPYPFAGRSSEAGTLAFHPEMDIGLLSKQGKGPAHGESGMRPSQVMPVSQAKQVREEAFLAMMDSEANLLRTEVDDLYRAINEWHGDPRGAPESRLRSNNISELFGKGLNRSAKRGEFAQASVTETEMLYKYMEWDFPRFIDEFEDVLRTALGDEEGAKLWNLLTRAGPTGTKQQSDLASIYKMLQHDKLNSWSTVQEHWRSGTASKPENFMAAIQELLGGKMMQGGETAAKARVRGVASVDLWDALATKGQFTPLDVDKFHKVVKGLVEIHPSETRKLLKEVHSSIQNGFVDFVAMKDRDFFLSFLETVDTRIKNADIQGPGSGKVPNPFHDAVKRYFKQEKQFFISDDDAMAYDTILDFFRKKAAEKIDINEISPSGTPYGSMPWIDGEVSGLGGPTTSAPGMWLSPNVNPGSPMIPRFAAGRILGVGDEWITQMIKEKGWPWVWRETEKIIYGGKSLSELPKQQRKFGQNQLINQHLSPERMATQSNPTKWTGTPGEDINLHMNYGNPEEWWAGQLGYSDLRDVPSHHLVRPVHEGDMEKYLGQLYKYKPDDVSDLEWTESLRHVRDYMVESRVNPIAARLYSRGQIAGQEGLLGRAGVHSKDVPAGFFGADPEELAGTAAQMRAAIQKVADIKKKTLDFFESELGSMGAAGDTRYIDDLANLRTVEIGPQSVLKRFIDDRRALEAGRLQAEGPGGIGPGGAMGPSADPQVIKAELFLMELSNASTDVKHNAKRLLDLDLVDGSEVLRRELDEMNSMYVKADERGFGGAETDMPLMRRKLSEELHAEDQGEAGGMRVGSGQTGPPEAQFGLDEEFFKHMGKSKHGPVWDREAFDHLTGTLDEATGRIKADELLESQTNSRQWVLDQLDEVELSNLKENLGEDMDKWPYWRIRRALKDKLGSLPEKERTNVFAQMARTVIDMRGKGFNEGQVQKLESKIRSNLDAAMDHESLAVGSGPMFVYDGKVWPDMGELQMMSRSTDLRTYPELMGAKYIDNASWSKKGTQMGLYEYLRGNEQGKGGAGITGFVSPIDDEFISIPDLVVHERIAKEAVSDPITRDPLQDLLVKKGLGRWEEIGKPGDRQVVYQDNFHLPREVAMNMLNVKKKMFDPSEIAGLFKAITHINGKLKSSITRYFPSFYTRNMISDTALSWVSGAVDVAVYPDAWAVAMKLEKEIDSLPEGGRFTSTLHLSDEIGNYGGYMGSRVAEIARMAANEAYDSNFAVFTKMVGEKMVGKGADPGQVKKTLAGLKTLMVMGMPKEYVPRLMEMGLSDLMELPERVTRSAHVLAKLRQGETFLESVRHMKKNLLDYADLTDFEKKYLSNVRMFYTWTRKVIPLLMDQMVRYPGRTATLTRATFQPSMPRDHFMPEFVRRYSGFAFGDNWFWGWGSPQEELMKLDPMSANGLSIMELLQNIGTGELSSLSPLIKGPLEGITGWDIFRRKQIQDIRTVGPEGEVLNWAQKAAGAVGFDAKSFINYNQTGGAGVGKSLGGITRSANPYALWAMRQPPVGRALKELGRAADVIGELTGIGDLDPRKDIGDQLNKLFLGFRITKKDDYSEWVAIEQQVRKNLIMEYHKGNVGRSEIWFLTEGVKDTIDPMTGFRDDESEAIRKRVKAGIDLIKRVKEEKMKARIRLDAGSMAPGGSPGRGSGVRGRQGGSIIPGWTPE